MKLVTAVVKPHVLEAVKDALGEINVTGMTVTEARGFGRQGGHTETYRGAEYKIDFVPKLKVEIVIDDENLNQVIASISEAAKTGKIGDGKIWVTPVDSLIRVRTSEAGVDAI